VGFVTCTASISSPLVAPRDVSPTLAKARAPRLNVCVLTVERDWADTTTATRIESFQPKGAQAARALSVTNYVVNPDSFPDFGPGWTW
jgi:hypothetical protein